MRWIEFMIDATGEIIRYYLGWDSPSNSGGGGGGGF